MTGLTTVATAVMRCAAGRLNAANANANAKVANPLFDAQSADIEPPKTVRPTVWTVTMSPLNTGTHAHAHTGIKCPC